LGQTATPIPVSEIMNWVKLWAKETSPLWSFNVAYSTIVLKFLLLPLQRLLECVFCVFKIGNGKGCKLGHKCLSSTSKANGGGNVLGGDERTRTKLQFLF